MELRNIFESADHKYQPIIRYLGIQPLNHLKELFEALKNRHGIMYDFIGFDYEDDHTVTFHDFSSENERNIHLDIPELIAFLEPLTNEYLKQNPGDTFIKECIRELNNEAL